jgi:hypothetical protein
MTNIEHDNFVGIYDGFFSPMYCEKLIKYHEWCGENNKTFNRPDLESIKKDSSVCMDPVWPNEIDYAAENLTGYIAEFNDIFWGQCYKDYMSAYSVLESHSNHTIFTYKIQKTDPAGGYHIWHCENGEKQYARRMGVYLLYLNDVEEGGETEFLYLGKRIQPKQGRLLIFPPNFPWSHRGNPPLSGSKYIMTGWMEFA